MDEQFDVSVIISTYNRCEMLPVALESLLAQDTAGARYEVIVVDNNSTDRTREVIESIIARGHSNLRYFFEGQQGLSYGWNTGIKHARAPILAFTDDDMCVARDYVASVKQAFDEYPAADFIGGKVLPHWKDKPPAWLTARHWAPLALQDHGETPFYTNETKQLCLLSKSFRREVFKRVGLFKPELGRIKDAIGSAEDHDLQLRIWQTGGQGMYIPGVVAYAEVQEERLTKKYHRRWHTGHGHFYALMRVSEFERDEMRLFDVPVRLYKQALKETIGWLKQSVRANAEVAFEHETEVRFIHGFFRQRRKEFKATKTRSSAREIAMFLQSLAGSKLNRKARRES
jgi:glycosyltransferase involved in cell wall biosynthesis